jgi:hypothetical protein
MLKNDESMLNLGLDVDSTMIQSSLNIVCVPAGQEFCVQSISQFDQPCYNGK